MNPFSAKDFVINYILLPVSVIFFVVYKFWNKTKWVRLEDMDLYTGRRADDTVVLEGVEVPWWTKVRRSLVG